jgi:hypothetical protein
VKRLFFGGAGTALAAKIVTGFAAAALAATAAGAVTEVAMTGSVNPENWGQQVKQQVATCKAELKTGQHGIGDCVSAFAKQHGKTVSAKNSAGEGPENDTSTGTNKGKHLGNGAGQGDVHGHAGQKPVDAPEAADATGS